MIQHFARLARTAPVCPKFFLRSNKMLTDICVKLTTYPIDREQPRLFYILTTKALAFFMLPQTTIPTAPKRGGTAWAAKPLALIHITLGLLMQCSAKILPSY